MDIKTLNEIEKEINRFMERLKAAQKRLKEDDFYVGYSGIRISDIDNIYELDDEKLDSMEVVYPPEDDEPDKTFREAIKGLSEPEIIASTAY